MEVFVTLRNTFTHIFEKIRCKVGVPDSPGGGDMTFQASYHGTHHGSNIRGGSHGSVQGSLQEAGRQGGAQRDYWATSDWRQHDKNRLMRIKSNPDKDKLSS